MMSTSTDDLLGYITVMQQVTDTANALFKALQLEQGSLLELERSEEAAVAAVKAEQERIAELEKEVKSKIAETQVLLDQLIAAAAYRSGVNSLGGYNSVGAGVGDPSQFVPEPSFGLITPMGRYTMTSPYGMRIHPFTGAYAFHDGLDMANACGTPIYSPANGFVTDYYWAGGYGNRLVIDHGVINGSRVVTSYNHLSSSLARPGSSVVQGEAVALVGSTGWSTGCHLHYMIWINGELVDPGLYV
jgi:murein DD-endopeptidase MepM/ murein hydrolase activator NlpD